MKMPAERSLIAFDPGGTTGVCVSYGGLITRQFELKGMHHQSLFALLNTHKPDYVIFEDFHFRQIDKADLTPVEYIGVLKLWSQINNRPYVSQTPAQGKKFWTDSKLKTAGVYVKGQPHAVDATRHMLHHLAFAMKDNHYILKLRTE